MKIKLVSVSLIIVIIICFFSSFSSVERTDNATHPYKFPFHPPAFGVLNVPSDNPMTVEGVWLGRLLFYDSLLSGNGKQSCASCHQQQLAFTDGKKLAVGSKGDINKFNTMSLVNLAFEHDFFWDGRAKTLEDQVPQPITNATEMNQTESELVRRLKLHAYYPQLFKQAFPNDSISMRTVSKALAQFLRTIISAGLVFPDYIDPKRDEKGEPDTTYMNTRRRELSIPGAIYRMSFACLGCHNTGTYGGGMANNEVAHDSVFKVPSLINITLTGPYMHDGRFKTLKEVLMHYQQHLSNLEAKNPKINFPAPITDKVTDFDVEHADEIFKYFTDSTIITNPAYGNPFHQDGFNWLSPKVN